MIYKIHVYIHIKTFPFIEFDFKKVKFDFKKVGVNL